MTVIIHFLSPNHLPLLPPSITQSLWRPPSAGFTSSWVALALAWKEAELTLADELGRLLGHDLRGRSRDESWEGIGKRRKAWWKRGEELGDTKWSIKWNITVMMMMVMVMRMMRTPRMLTTTRRHRCPAKLLQRKVTGDSSPCQYLAI